MAIRVPPTGGEKESLKAALERHRDVVLWKVEGLTDEQLRRPMTPSGTTLLGLVKHLANMEYLWFCSTFGRESDAVPLDVWRADPEADMRVGPNETTAEVLTFYGRARAAADQAIDDIFLDKRGRSWSGEEVTMRWALINMVEEVARHAGHMDIIRELIDGETGDHR
jgi:hypothetical protein